MFEEPTVAESPYRVGEFIHGSFKTASLFCIAFNYWLMLLKRDSYGGKGDVDEVWSCMERLEADGLIPDARTHSNVADVLLRA